MIFGFHNIADYLFCACQTGIINLDTGKLISFPYIALSCDIYDIKVAVGFDNMIIVYTLQEESLIEEFR